MLYSAHWRATPYLLVPAMQSGPGTSQIAPTGYAPSASAPLESHRKSLHFKPVSEAPRVTKIAPKVIEKHVKMKQSPNRCAKFSLRQQGYRETCKNNTEIKHIPTYVQSCFCNTSRAKCLLPELQASPKSSKT